MSKQNSTTGLYEHPQDRNVSPPKAVVGTSISGNGLQAGTGFIGWTPGNVDMRPAAGSPVQQLHNGATQQVT